jgi:lincosamide nucleotidyltransferase A/C/D/E
MIHAQDAKSICQSLAANHIPVWLLGGWGIDALLQEETRPHKDLDIFVLVDDVAQVLELLSRDGYSLSYLWPENTWSVDSHGTQTPTAFVLQDPGEREVDLHAMRIDDEGNGIPLWANPQGLVFKKEDLNAEGTIAGFAVRCLSPTMQMVCHTGYDVPDAQLRDLGRLRDRFGVEFPAGLSSSRQRGA